MGARDIEKAIQADEGDVLKGISNTDIIKAAQSAAITMDTLYDSVTMIQQPKYREDWLALYKQHVWTNACVLAKATTVAKLEYGLYKVNRRTKEKERQDAHPLLLLLDYPNPQTTYYDWMELQVMHLELTGNSYSEIVYETNETTAGKKTVVRNSLPKELWTIRPDYLTPIPKKGTGELDYWLFQVRKYANTKKFGVDEILPFGYTDPTNPLFGMGSATAAIDDIRQDNAMAKWNLDFFGDNLTPQGVFTTEATLQPWQAQEYAEQIKQFLVGSGRKVLVLGKGLAWEMMSTNPKDVDFLAGRAENRQAVLAAFGVPPVKVGLLEHAKYDNYGLQTDAFHRDTILPLTRKLEGSINLWLVPRFPDLQRTDDTDFLIQFDVEELIAEDQDRVTDRTVKAFDRGWLTINEALGELNKPKIEDDAIGDMRFIDNRLITLDAAINPPEVDGMSNSLDDTGEELVKNMRALEGHIDRSVAEQVKAAVAKIKKDLE